MHSFSSESTFGRPDTRTIAAAALIIIATGLSGCASMGSAESAEGCYPGKISAGSDDWHNTMIEKFSLPASQATKLLMYADIPTRPALSGKEGLELDTALATPSPKFVQVAMQVGIYDPTATLLVNPGHDQANAIADVLKNPVAGDDQPAIIVVKPAKLTRYTTKDTSSIIVTVINGEC